MAGKYPQRFDLTNEEIEIFVKKYFLLENKLTSLFNPNKIYDKVSSWVDSFARNGISKNSKDLILFRICVKENKEIHCKYCRKEF